MKTVSVREFSYNPSAMFAEVERGETIEVTKHGTVIAVLAPPEPRKKSRYEEMVEQGLIRPATGSGRPNRETYKKYRFPDDVDPVALLLEMRAEERY